MRSLSYQNIGGSAYICTQFGRRWPDVTSLETTVNWRQPSEVSSALPEFADVSPGGDGGHAIG
jgi:hypothetical protein